MGFAELATSLLVGLSSVLHVAALPPTGGAEADGWTISRAWQAAGPVTVLEASSRSIVSECGAHPGESIQFPEVIHGAHEILLDGKPVLRFGDPAFRMARSFYGAPVLACSELAGGHQLTWRVYAYSRYFARIPYFPRLTRSPLLAGFLAESFDLLATGALVILSLFTLIVFWRKEQRPLTLSISLAALAWSVYSGGTVPALLGIRAPMLEVHKVADTGLWVGAALFFNALRLEKVLGGRLYAAYLANLALAELIILASPTGDAIQLGTSLPFGLTLFIIIESGLKLLRLGAREARNLLAGTGSGGYQHLLGFASLFLFFSACVNDLLVVTGLSQSHMLAAGGFMFGLMFFAFSINAKIDEVYRQNRNYERNLERLVEEKTAELSSKTRQLESALITLNESEGERQHQARLLSLGTLAAGIAHEINNSLNYVHGALIPVERLTRKLVPQEEFARLEKLFGIMKEGLKLTFEIIQSLKSYSGVNQARNNDVDLEGVVGSVLTILKSRLTEKVAVTREIEPGLRLFGNVVGLNQVLMNLISNAIDAMPEGGAISIRGRYDGPDVVLSVGDSGAGMPEEIRSRIFDPFFTTKEVGAGTGLGLYIVKREIDRHRGAISVRTSPGQGTTFELRLPRAHPDEEGIAA